MERAMNDGKDGENYLHINMEHCLIGCREDPSGALSFQEKECRFTAECKVKAGEEEQGGEYVVEILHSPDGSGEIVFLSPETIAGCKYLRTASGEYSFQTEDLIFPVTKNPTTEAIFSLFALSEEDLLKANTDEISGESLNVLTFDGNVILYLDRHGQPLYYDHPNVTMTIRVAAKCTNE